MLVQRLDASAAPAAPALGGTAGSAIRVVDGAQAAPPAAGEPAAPEFHAAAAQANRAMAARSATIQFEVDPDTRITVVKIIDSSDQQVLRQVPSQEMIEIARALDRVRSLLIHAVA